MIIRQAVNDDAETIGAQWLSLVMYHRKLDSAMPIAAENGADDYAQRVRFSLMNPQNRVLVADDNGTVIGYIMGSIQNMLPDMFIQEQAGFIADLYVMPDYRRQGIGLALVTAMKNWFQARGVDQFEWYVASANTTGVNFWRHVIGGRDLLIRMRADMNNDLSNE